MSDNHRYTLCLWSLSNLVYMLFPFVWLKGLLHRGTSTPCARQCFCTLHLSRINLTLYPCCYLHVFAQVWHQPWEYHPVRTKHRHGAHGGLGITVWVCCCGPPLSSHLWHESGLPWHQENVLLWCLPQVSFSLKYLNIVSFKRTEQLLW